MTNESEPDLTVVLRRLGVHTPTLYELQTGSTDAVLFLSAIAKVLNTLAVTDFGGRIGPVRQDGLVEQVVGAALQTFGGIDPHPGAFAKASMLLRGITAGHPFQDGNKRTGVLVAAFYLEYLGYPVPEELPVDEVEAMCLQISAGNLRDVEEIAQLLERFWQYTD